MSIRWKLILAIGLPLVLLLGALQWFDYQRLRATAYAEYESRMRQVAHRFAEQYDSVFRAMAEVAVGEAVFVEVAHSATLADLYQLLKQAVERHPDLYGACIAFEPGEGPGGGERLAPYVVRRDTGLEQMNVADAYDYRDGRWEWYRSPRESKKADWTEPYFDLGAGDTFMVTHSVPIFRDEKFIGVATVDVRLSDLQASVLADAPADTFAFVISRSGLLIVSPFLEDMGRKHMLDECDASNINEMTEVARQMMAGNEGIARFRGFGNDNMMFGFYAPIASTGWSLAGLVSETEVMRPVFAMLAKRTAVGVAAIAAILGIVIVMASWIVRPAARLAKAVEGLGSGDLNVQALGVTSHDEIGRLAKSFNTMVANLRSHVEALTKETSAREAMERELAVARQIQRAMLPRSFPIDARFTIHGVSSPARSVGGDFFDVFPTSGNDIAIVIADVSGKGVPAALFMAMTRALLRSMAARRDASLDPGELLTTANARLALENAENFFVTLFLARYNPATGLVRYANAGHPPPMLLRADASVHESGPPTGTIFGVLGDQRYDEGHFTLAPGDRLVLFTDGVSEAHGKDKELYGTERFATLLQTISNSDPVQICDHTLERLREFQGPDQSDDITLLVMARTDDGARGV